MKTNQMINLYSFETMKKALNQFDMTGFYSRCFPQLETLPDNSIWTRSSHSVAKCQ